MNSSTGSIPQFLVVDADPRGYMDKDVAVSFYPFSNRAEAYELAQRLANYRYEIAKLLGGYPGAVYTLDLCDPDAYDDPKDLYEVFEEMDVEEEDG